MFYKCMMLFGILLFTIGIYITYGIGVALITSGLIFSILGLFSTLIYYLYKGKNLL